LIAILNERDIVAADLDFAVEVLAKLVGNFFELGIA